MSEPHDEACRCGECEHQRAVEQDAHEVRVAWIEEAA